MTQKPITVYFNLSNGGVDNDGNGRVRVWTVFIDNEGALREYVGHARSGALDRGFDFTKCIVHKGPGGKAKGDEMITEKRLFKGFQILPEPYLLDTETLEARPDPDAPALTGMAGETLPIDPGLNPDARALGSPNWFF